MSVLVMVTPIYASGSLIAVALNYMTGIKSSPRFDSEKSPYCCGGEITDNDQVFDYTSKKM